MIELKDYQHRVLDSLREFFRGCEKHGRPDVAFGEVLRRNNASEAPYLAVQGAGLHPETPYVCLRVPTGGGKTLLACYTVGLATTEFLRAARSVVLWLVPSNTILSQTADALRDTRHPYRQALQQSAGAVEVVTIEEALRLSRASLDGQTVVIVATIQSFRVEETADRKVYEQNGTFADHFQNLPAGVAQGLMSGPDGRPIPSLVNVLRVRRPVVIVDEAHNARTELSFSTLAAVAPSCIVEFTATPARNKQPSNVLHRVSAAELKAEHMVKLPLRVVTRHPSQRDQLLAEAVKLRLDLERLSTLEAQATGEYIRPILLIQAERVDGCVPLRDRLVSDFKLSKDEVCISVAELDELPSAEKIRRADCPIRVIITVQKLREGWDCPFAYVLCSLRETRSPTAIEQIAGRILRLPQAREKQHPDLNCSYAFSISPTIVEVLAELRDALERHGFTAAEAERIVIPVAQGALPLGNQPQSVEFTADELNAESIAADVVSLAGKVRLEEREGRIVLLTPLSAHETEQVMNWVTSDRTKQQIRDAATTLRDLDIAFGGTGNSRVPSFYEQRIDFAVPRLCVREGEELLEFESTFLLERPWRLSQKDASLSEGYDPRQRPTGRVGRVDVGTRGEVVTGETTDDFVSTLHKQVLDLGSDDPWTLEALVAWLDSKIDHSDIPSGESGAYLRNVVRGLLARFDLDDVGVLAIDRFRLRDEVEQSIQRHRERERLEAFQGYLLPTSPLVVSDTEALNFKTIQYEPSWTYEGNFAFKKHYFGQKPGELRRNGEEARCAEFIDGLEEVAFWVRNLVRKPTSFRLQTSGDWFYPDFICQLVDGRVMAVEYKGAHLWADAEEKRAVGAVWASRSNGRCLFVMPTNEDFSSIPATIGGGRI